MAPAPQPVSLRRHTSATYPSRSWGTWLFGRPLLTADAAEQAIGKQEATA